MNQDNVFLRLSYALREFKQEKKTTFILGAGCSLTSTPNDISTTGIMKSCLIEHGINVEDISSWEELYQKFVNVVWEGKGREEQKRLLKNKLDDADPTEGHRQLRALIESGFVNNIITTNFDMLLEKTFIGLSYNKRSGCNKYLKIGEKPTFNLLKVHGDLDDGDLRFSPSELMSLPEPLSKDIQRKTEGLLVVIGYRGQDIGLMNSISKKDNFATYWVDINELDKLDAFSTKSIYTFMLRRKSERNFLYGSEFGDFSEILRKLGIILLNPKHTTIIKSKENFSNKEWLNTSIVELLSIHGRIYELFLDILKISKNIQSKLKWKVGYPSYAENYDDLLSAYLYFFYSNKVPVNLLHIPSNEVDALVLGVSIEVIVRAEGNGINPDVFLSELKTGTNHLGHNKNFDVAALWPAVENVIHQNFPGDNQLKLRMQNNISVEASRIPMIELNELVGTLSFLSLLIPNKYLEPLSMDEKYTIRRFLSGKYKNVEISHEKIIVHLGKICSENLNKLYMHYLKKIPNIKTNTLKKKIETKDHAYFETKWLSITLEIDDNCKADTLPNYNNQSHFLMKESEQSISSFLKIGYPSSFDAGTHVDLGLDIDLSKFIESKKIGIFIVGTSGSGKTRALQNFAFKSRKNKNLIVIAVSPKSRKIDHKGIEIFFKHPPYKKEKIKAIDDQLKKSGKTLVLILDGLNEINDNIETQKSHYLEISNLVDNLAKQKCRNTKVIVSCRTGAYRHYKNLSSVNLNPLIFFSNNKPENENIEIDSSYTVRTLSEEEKNKLNMLYHTKIKSNEKNISRSGYLYNVDSFFHENATPFLISLLGEQLKLCKEKGIKKNIELVFDRFTVLMLGRLPRADTYKARKIVYAYFDAIINASNEKMEVTRFKIMENFPLQTHAEYLSVMDRMIDVNIFINQNQELERVSFQHDKIEEFFFIEYIQEQEHKGSEYIIKIFELMSENIIYQSGITLYLANLLQNNKINLLYQILMENSFPYGSQLPRMTVEALCRSDSLEKIIIKLFDVANLERHNRLINILVAGLDSCLQNYSNTTPDYGRIIAALLSSIDSIAILQKNSSYILFFQSKLLYFKNNYASALVYADEAIEFSDAFSDQLTSKINIHSSVIFMELGLPKKSIRILSKEFNKERFRGRTDGMLKAGIELGRALNHCGKTAEPLEIYQELLDSRTSIEDPYVLARLYEQKANVLNRIMYRILDYGRTKKYLTKNKYLIEVNRLFENSIELYAKSSRLLLKTNSIFTYTGVVPEMINTYISYSYSVKPKGIKDCRNLITEMDQLFEIISTPYEGDYLIAKAYYFEYLGNVNEAIEIADRAILKTSSMGIKNKEAKCQTYKSNLIYRGLLENKFDSNRCEIVREGIESLESAIDYYTKYTTNDNSVLLDNLELIKKLKATQK